MRIAGGDRPIDDQPVRGNAAAIVGVAILLSGAAHAALLTWALLARAPNPYNPNPAQAITVDLVASDEVVEQKVPETPVAEINPPESAPQSAPTPPDLRGTEEPLTPQRPAGPVVASAPTPPQPPSPQSTPPQPAPPPVAAVQPPPPPPAQPVEPQTAAPPVSTFGLEAIAGAETAPTGGEEPPADQDAQLSQENVAAFREQLKKCWRVPAGVDSSTKMKMVLRVYLTPSGTITREPVLLQASASPEGPAVVLAAMRTIRQCQPYKSLPADRYNEWKVLDVTLSPRELAGG
jgi:hypothetical protein